MNTLLWLLVPVLAASVDGGKISWSREPLDVRLAAARRAGKPTIAYFRADGSGACLQLDRGAFSEEAIVRQSEAYERVLVDCTDRAVMEEMRRKYGIEIVPTVHIYAPDGRLAERFGGTRTSDVVLRVFATFAPADRTAERRTADRHEPEWRDTHRVHLRNGNFLDGRIETEGSETELVLRFHKSAAVTLRRSDIVAVDRIRTGPVRSEERPGAGPVWTETRRSAAVSVGDPEPPLPAAQRDLLLEDIALLNGPVAEEELHAIVGRLNRLGEGGGAYLVWLLKSPRWEERRDAARALGHLKKPFAVAPVLAALAAEKEWPVQEQACLALGRLGDPAAIPLLLETAKWRQDPVRRAALLALEMITNELGVRRNPDAWDTWWRLNKHRFGK